LTVLGLGDYRRRSLLVVDRGLFGVFMKPDVRKKVDVALQGHRFTVKTEKDEAYVHSLAAQVARKIDEVRRQMRNISREEAALLVALNMADELAEERERASSARAEVRRHTDAMIAKLNAALLEEGASLEDDSEEVSIALSRQL
jgi:cell division protein ZapA (FtsZ GTPase activity inhibitor)